MPRELKSQFDTNTISRNINISAIYINEFLYEKRKTDNNDLIQYLDTVKELKNHISIEEYRNKYRKLRADGIPFIKAQKFKSALILPT